LIGSNDSTGRLPAHRYLHLLYPMAEYLNPEDLQIVTGYARPRKQAQWLKENDIPHRVDGARVIVSHHHVRFWLEGRLAAPSGDFNWASVK